MSMTSLSVEARRAVWTARLADYLELTKPKISVLVLVTVAVAAIAGSAGAVGGWQLANTLLGTALVAASASALNQFFERRTDALMERTENRPLPAGRLSTREVLLFGAVTIALGAFWLVAFVNLAAAGWGLLTWALYVWVYTPMKTRTTSNTPLGAIAGAMPVLIGWSAAGASIDLRAWGMFLTLYLWQFPHFMAIAWIYRNQYAGAGLKMTSVVDKSGYRTGALAVSSALWLIPVSLVPALGTTWGELYLTWAVLLGLAQLVTAISFFVERSDQSARRLLFASLVYLPVLLGLIALGPMV